jgi:hypothetical protein
MGGTSCSKCIIMLGLFLNNFKSIPNLIISLQRCNDPPNGRKCKHVNFRNHGLNNLESMHVMFVNHGLNNLESMHVMFVSAHVIGASASTPRDLSDNPSDDNVHEVEKNPSNVFSDLPKKGKKRKTPSSNGMEDKEERSSFV